MKPQRLSVELTGLLANPLIDREVAEAFPKGRARLYQVNGNQYIVLDGGKSPRIERG